ncbi:hypothetical protein [Mesorhizobium kowhaii]|uniref:Uncharacterized protein n=1 Tax=Mesorhizobium kowhaii TaxID=1300272 RepID=A0A2W7BZT3_9HYPH|nr:hypothetical protein [Mesorhizobium kowhaii]PZV36157.1 hypothetical protein B5V02_23410 [Mesorhizobium kowhaii]
MTFPFPSVVANSSSHVATWQTNAQANPTGNNGGWNGYTHRERILAAGLSNGGGSKVRVTLKAGSSAGFTIDSCYIGAGASVGDTYDFETTPTQLLFNGGNAGVTVTTGNSILSDEITYTVDASKNLIVSMHFSATSAVGIDTGATNWNGYSKAAVSEAGTVNVSGYSAGGGNVSYGLAKVESFV